MTAADTIEDLISSAWDAHDQATAAGGDNPNIERLRAAIWALEDVIDDPAHVTINTTLGELPREVGDRLVSMVLAFWSVQAVLAA